MKLRLWNTLKFLSDYVWIYSQYSDTDDHGLGFQLFLVKTRAFIIYTWSRQNTMGTLVIKMKNEKPLILLLSILNIISGNSEIFFFYFYPWGYPANFRNCKVRTSEKRGTTLLGFFWDVTPWNLADKYKRSWEICPHCNILFKCRKKKSPKRLCLCSKNTASYPSLVLTANETEISKAFNDLFECLLCNSRPWSC